MPRSLNKFFLALTVLLLISVACSVSGSAANNAPENSAPDNGVPENNTPTDAPENTPAAGDTTEGDSSSQLDCESAGYPCSYADSDPAALERSNELLDEAADMVGETGETASVAAYLESLDEVVEVYFDERAILFRVQDSAPMVVFHPDFGPDFSDLTVQTSAVPKLARPISPSPALSDSGPIGPQDAGQEPKKKALLLSLFLWDFEDDEVDDIAAKLPNHRDYDCGDCIEVVTITDNPMANTTGQFQVGPGVENFLGWQQYDLIHISTHGTQFCHSGLRAGCITLLQTGGFRNEETIGEQNILTGTNISPYPGVYYGRSSELPKGWRMELVATDFFRSQYPSGLSDTLVFFSSCQTLKGTDLADALTASNTAILGWNESVDAYAAEEITIKFYEFLVGDGLRAKIAYDKTKGFGGFALGFAEADADLLIKGTDEPRGREVVTLIHPFRLTNLNGGDTITTQGIAGDGENDSLFIAARVDGIDADQTPGDFVVHLSINGQNIDSTLTPTTKVGEYSYQTNMFAVPLPMDVNNQQSISLEAWIDLPEGGQTRHFLETVNPVGCGWNGVVSDTGEFSGNEVINTHDPGMNTDEAQLLLRENNQGQYIDFAAGATNSPMVIVMSTESSNGFPILTASNAVGSISLGPGAVYGTQNLDFVVFNTGERLYGTLSGSYRGASRSKSYTG